MEGCELTDFLLETVNFRFVNLSTNSLITFSHLLQWIFLVWLHCLILCKFLLASYSGTCFSCLCAHFLLLVYSFLTSCFLYCPNVKFLVIPSTWIYTYIAGLLSCMIHCGRNLFMKPTLIFFVSLLIYLKLKSWENSLADGVNHWRGYILHWKEFWQIFMNGWPSELERIFMMRCAFCLESGYCWFFDTVYACSVRNLPLSFWK